MQNLCSFVNQLCLRKKRCSENLPNFQYLCLEPLNSDTYKQTGQVANCCLARPCNCFVAQAWCVEKLTQMGGNIYILIQRYIE